MAYNDKKFGQLFPTRHGGAIGSSNERAMLDRLGSSDGYRTSVRMNADGSTTTLKTRNGVPRFMTTRPTEVSTEEYSSTVYMETGQLEAMPTAPEHPDRGKPAKWHFIGIDPESDYLGKIKIAENGLGGQKNKTKLTEGMDSLAIGYPRSDDPVEDAKRKAQYLDATIMKTLVSGLFPASLWSGAMRLFMQAKYGAKQMPEIEPLRVDIVGTEVVLRYYNYEGQSIQLGLWGHHSPGIFVAVNGAGVPIGKFWLLTITNPTGSQFIVTSYKLKFNSGGKSILRQYRKLAKTSAFTPGIRAKLEAYLYAHSLIDVANPKIVGSFAGAPGGPMAYGWKFNSIGSRASMVSNELLGTGVHDLRWNSNTTHVSISHDFDAETKTDVLAISAQVTPGGEWTDGWGAYNIFVPLEDIGNDALGHASLAVNQFGVMPPFAFSVPVYGFYKDDVWQAVTMSRMIEPGPWPKYTQQNSMPYPNPGVPDTYTDRYQVDARLVDHGWGYVSFTRYQSSLMDLTVGDATYNGVSWFGTGQQIAQSVSVGGWGAPGSWFDYINPTIGDAVYFDVVSAYGPPPGYAEYIATAFDPPQSALDFSSRSGSMTTDYWNTTGWSFHTWTLVIPAGDCEAVFVGTHKYEQHDAVEHIQSVKPCTTGLRCRGMIVIPYASSEGYGSGGSSTTDAAPPPTTTAEIYCFNTHVSGAQGAYHASSTPLFIVDKNWPFYMAGMGAITSYGGKYAITEGLVSPASVSYTRRFVGWA